MLHTANIKKIGSSPEFMGNYRTKDKEMQQVRDSVKIAIRHNRSLTPYYSVLSLDRMKNLQKNTSAISFGTAVFSFFFAGIIL